MSDKTVLLNPQNLAVAGSFTAGTGGGAITTSGGVLGFGTFTTSAGLANITGFIEIIDKNGAARRLAVLA